ncbi:response regulator [Spirochaetia bacterium 38H-sp]|uniref:histidine kinase n=1 Tax=Rarispira pelagica TaxID=3141764 RepID=A0ABU9UBI0_9SPIR
MDHLSSLSASILINVLEKAPVGMVVLSEESKIIAVNNTFVELIDWSEDELSGVNFCSLAYHEDEPVLSSFIEKLRQTDSGQSSILCRFSRRDGFVYWFRMWAFKEQDKIFISVFDQTNQKLTEEQLKREREDAIRATQSKSAFLANMSHEIRTPLHTILGMAELLKDTNLDEEQRDYVQQIRFSGEALLALINDILDFSKIEAGKLPLEVIDFDLHEALEQAISMVCLQAHKKKLEVILDIDMDVPRVVKGDPLRVRQIMVNLASNAVKFTSEGFVKCSARLVQRLDSTAWILLQMQDTGIGIPDDKKDRLFRAFSQIDESTTRRYGGTGLGLAISRNLVGMMGGEIGVISQEGIGSTFWALIPFPVISDYDIPKFDGDADSLLILDDNDDAAAIIRKYMSPYFKRIEHVTGAEAALKLMREKANRGEIFDLVLVDLWLRGMDGWQFASEVNADKSINDTKLILMTPMGESTEAKMKLLHWFDAYISKPVKRGELYKNVFKVLSETMELDIVEEADGRDVSSLAVGGYHLLVAEDHIVNQQLFLTILSKMGYDVDIANNGREAVDKGLSVNPDLVFMDMQMPELNGIDATIELRKRGYKGPIIAVTANAFKEDKERCIAAGMNDFLPKPFKKDDLVSVLAKWLVPNNEKKGGNREGDARSVSVIEELEELEENSEIGESMIEDKNVFDYKGALEAFMEDADVLKNVLASVLDKIPTQIELIKQALDDGDMETVRTESHGIKGGSWNLCMKHIGDIAAKVEAAAKDGDVEKCRTLLPELEKSFELTGKVIKSYL